MKYLLKCEACAHFCETTVYIVGHNHFLQHCDVEQKRPDSQICELKLPLTVAAAPVAAGGDDKQDRPDYF